MDVASAELQAVRPLDGKSGGLSRVVPQIAIYLMHCRTTDSRIADSCNAMHQDCAKEAKEITERMFVDGGAQVANVDQWRGARCRHTRSSIGISSAWL